MSENGTEADYELVGKTLTLVAVGVVVPGIVARYLNEVGYGVIGTFIFGMSFFALVFIAWYIWIRPIDLTGPMG
ncbi:hypothetical protein [Natranaeroarchaeum sulfidigenes]|uniref:Putative membrane protein n=1 Tax=Natranaeroarchaeum sulfidigenes TaxID=2784880 RepID=A0A897MU76_9EURY|nr:hypothetical protein [Natranaeroarchaeum sulfidigenes]QSG04027.1 putative membrane protein [Natranaeroarchaeum sulfidigenes]